MHQEREIKELLLIFCLFVFVFYWIFFFFLSTVEVSGEKICLETLNP